MPPESPQALSSARKRSDRNLRNHLASEGHLQGHSSPAAQHSAQVRVHSAGYEVQTCGAEIHGGTCGFSSFSFKFANGFANTDSSPEVSFVICGLGGAGVSAGNATAMFGKVTRQHRLVTAQTDGAPEDLEDKCSMSVLMRGKSEVLISKRR